MKNIVFKLPKGQYTNSDAIQRVIGYISADSIIPVIGYGFWPPLPDTAIEQFEEVYNIVPYTPQRNIWHFVVSFDSSIKEQSVLSTAVSICQIFCTYYQILYGIHIKRETSCHIHFAVNPISFQPPHTELTMNIMKNYIEQIKQLLINTYPSQVILEGVE